MKRKQGCEAYEEWLEGHSAQCSINHTGSSGMMEVVAANTIWRRSLQRGLRYTTMVSDGDSKTFAELGKLKPYDVPVHKEECTNHTSKRLGTALRNLVTSESSKGNTLGGRKPGSLTQVKINLLQRYYESVVASKCQTVEELQQKIWRAFYHASSSDSNPQHHFCPGGKESSCFYNRAIALGLGPPSHNQHQSKTYLSPHVASYVKPVYERLTSNALLERCLQGLTQNANESSTPVCGQNVPNIFLLAASELTLRLCSLSANSTAVAEVCRTSCSLGCMPNGLTRDMGVMRDRKRVAVAERRCREETKPRRVQIAQASGAAQAELLRQEGNVYAPGAF